MWRRTCYHDDPRTLVWVGEGRLSSPMWEWVMTWQWAPYHPYRCSSSNSHRRLQGSKNVMAKAVNNSKVIDWSQLYSSFLIYILSNFFLHVFYFFIHLKTWEFSALTKAAAGEDWILFNLLFFLFSLNCQSNLYSGYESAGEKVTERERKKLREEEKFCKAVAADTSPCILQTPQAAPGTGGEFSGCLFCTKSQVSKGILEGWCPGI